MTCWPTQSTKNETDLAEQVNLVEQMIAQQVKAIVIAPADSKALATVLKHAKESGILVINIDNKLDADVLKQAGLQIPFVGPDNRAGAKKVGDVIAGHLKSGDNVAIIEGIPTAFNGQQRRLGFEDAMKAAGVNIVSVQSGDWEMEKANNVATAILSEHPDIKAILCDNDNMALGAVSAIEAAGKTGRVLVAGFDNISAIHPLLDKGAVTVTADQHGELAGKVFGNEAAAQTSAGVQATPTDQTTPVETSSPNNAGEAYLANEVSRKASTGEPPPFPKRPVTRMSALVTSETAGWLRSRLNSLRSPGPISTLSAICALQWAGVVTFSFPRTGLSPKL